MCPGQRGAATNIVVLHGTATAMRCRSGTVMVPEGPGSAAHHERAHGHSIVLRDIDTLVLHRIRDSRLSLGSKPGANGSTNGMSHEVFVRLGSHRTGDYVARINGDSWYCFYWHWHSTTKRAGCPGTPRRSDS